MKAASLKELKSALAGLSNDELTEICIRLSKFRKENKELITYLLFEAHDESSYVQEVRSEVDGYFESVPKGNVYFIKKNLRKILRFMNRQIKYSGLPATEIELRIHFCRKMKEAKIPMHTGTVLYNLYQQQIRKVNQLLSKLPEDLRADFSDVDSL